MRNVRYRIENATNAVPFSPYPRKNLDTACDRFFSMKSAAFSATALRPEPFEAASGAAAAAAARIHATSATLATLFLQVVSLYQAARALRQ